MLCHTQILRKRKGFVKVALESGAHLVPTLLFGENDLFWTHIPAPGSFSAWMQRAVQKWFGFTMPKFWGEPLLWGECHVPVRCRWAVHEYIMHVKVRVLQCS
jgi:hypothetical protein